MTMLLGALEAFVVAAVLTSLHVLASGLLSL